MLTTLMAVVFFICMTLEIPIVFCLGITAAVSLVFLNLPLQVVAQEVFIGMDSFSLIAVPFFVLAADLMNHGGITVRLIRFAYTLVGWMRGGLAHTNIIASMFLAGISGSGMSGAYAIGGIMIPRMKKEGYDIDFSAAVTAAAATMGPIIPPSILMVIYGVTTDTSIGALFAAGFIPGILIAVFLMIVAYVISQRRNYPHFPPLPLPEVAEAFKKVIFALLAPVIILGGILLGFFTPTEAAAVAVLYALAVGLFLLKELRLAELPKILIHSGVTTSVLLLIIGAANVVSWVLSIENAPQNIAGALLEISQNPYLILFLINIFLLIVGMFMDGGAAIIILAPVLNQVAKAVGIHPLHFGFVMVLNIVIGELTPPLGVVLFAVCGIAKIELIQLFRALIPFLLVEMAVLFLVSYFPWLVLWLPRLMGFV